MERLEDRAVQAGYTAANIHDLVASLGAGDARGGMGTIAAVVGRPPAPGHSLAGRGLPSLDTYVDSNGSSYTIANTYDARGNPTSYELEYDNDADGVVDQITLVTYTYEEEGASQRAVEAAQSDYNADGVIDFQHTATRTFDAHGNLVLFVDLVDNNADGTPDDRVVVAYTYDARGNIIQYATEFGIASAGLPVYRSVETSTYDAKGNITSDVIDLGADGVTDGITTYTNTYDSRGRLASALYEQDYCSGTLPDGKIDVIETFTYMYDDRADLTRRVIEGDFDADGAIDLLWRFDYTYDARGNLTRTAEEAASFYADGTTSVYRSPTTNTYDARGNLILSVEEYDFDGDGVVDAASTHHLAY